ncbi:MAG: hypothetical protein JNG84_09005 [Archangium sp.]|nr:hypothetical protein [Archangium sp.]
MARVLTVMAVVMTGCLASVKEPVDAGPAVDAGTREVNLLTSCTGDCAYGECHDCVSDAEPGSPDEALDISSCLRFERPTCDAYRVRHIGPDAPSCASGDAGYCATAPPGVGLPAKFAAVCDPDGGVEIVECPTTSICRDGGVPRACAKLCQSACIR